MFLWSDLQELDEFTKLTILGQFKFPGWLTLVENKLAELDQRVWALDPAGDNVQEEFAKLRYDRDRWLQFKLLLENHQEGVSS